MFRRKKGFTAVQSKRTSKHMQSATLGTHVQRRTRTSSRRHMNADAVGFSNARKERRAARGVIKRVSLSGESKKAEGRAFRRKNKRQFAQMFQRKIHLHRIAVVILAVLLVVGVAGGVGIATFIGSLNSKLSLGDSSVSKVLTPHSEKEPYYLLLSARLGTATGSDDNASSAYLLARIDESQQAVTLVSLPANLQVRLSDGALHPLFDTFSLGGDAALVSAVANFAGVDISHLVKTNAQGIEHIVETVGGVEVYVPEEVDDPQAGDVYLSPGTQILDASASLTLLRAGNFSDSAAVQAENRAGFAASLAESLLRVSGVDFIMQLDKTAGDVQTDLSAFQVVALADAMRGMKAEKVYVASVPGTEVSIDGVRVYKPTKDAWESVMERVRAGEDPSIKENPAASVDKGSFTIAVRNGAGITGGAKQLSEILQGEGFNVVETGNVEDFTTYPETLIIYHDDAYALAAEAIIQSLGVGRAFNGGDYYSFTPDVLIVIGQDWQPIV